MIPVWYYLCRTKVAFNKEKSVVDCVWKAWFKRKCKKAYEIQKQNHEQITYQMPVESELTRGYLSGCGRKHCFEHFCSEGCCTMANKISFWYLSSHLLEEAMFTA